MNHLVLSREGSQNETSSRRNERGEAVRGEQAQNTLLLLDELWRNGRAEARGFVANRAVHGLLQKKL